VWSTCTATNGRNAAPQLPGEIARLRGFDRLSLTQQAALADAEAELAALEAHAQARREALVKRLTAGDYRGITFDPGDGQVPLDSGQPRYDHRAHHVGPAYDTARRAIDHAHRSARSPTTPPGS
jgi:hypothetical protein